MGKLLLRWQVALALAGLIAVWAILTLGAAPAAVPTPSPAVATPTSSATPAPLAGDPTVCRVPVPLRGGVLVEGVVGAPFYPNPLLADPNPVDRQIVDLIFDGLVALDASGLPQPALARAWTVGEDGRSVRFELRDDVQWHDGTPFTAEDVAFTYGLLQAEDAVHPDAALWRSVTIEVTGATHIVFTLAEPYAPLLEATTRGILPAHLLTGVTLAQLADHPFNNRPIGTGPFMAANDWLADGVLRLAPNPAYFDVAALNIAGIEQRFFADEAARAAALAAGSVHMLAGIDPAAVPEVLAVPGVRLTTSTAERYSELLFNMSNPDLPVADRDVRLALTLGLDRDALIAQALNGQGVPFDGPYLPASWAYVPEMTARATDLSAAAELLTEAGWELPAEGGTRSRRTEEAEQPLTLRLLLGNSAQNQRVAQAVTQQWEALGVGIVLQPVDVAGLRDALLARDYDLALLTVQPLADPDLYDFWSQEAIVSGQNYGGWNDRIASEALEAGRQLWDPALRYPYYVTFARRFDEALPALPLYYHVWSVAAGEQLLSAQDGAPIVPGFMSRPRERFAGLPQWTLGFEQVAVACAP